MKFFKTIKQSSVLLSLAMLFFVACFFGNTEHETVDLDVDSFTHLVVETTTGTIRVIASDQWSIEAEHHFTGNESQTVRMEISGDTATVRTVCGADSGMCWTDYDFYVPATISLDLESGAGDILVEAMESDLVAETDSGQIQVISFIGDMDLIQGSGSIDLTEVTGDVTLSCDSGSITGWNLDTPNFIADVEVGKTILQMDTAPELVSVQSDSGGVDLTVPVDVYDLELATNTGGMNVVNLEDTNGATRVIEIGTDSGGISVTGIESAE